MTGEHSIIEGCKKNDRKAQELLYKSYYAAMARLCLRYTANDHDAVEVLNKGFLKVFLNIHRYDPGKGTLYTWIRTIIINSCFDFLKIREKTTAYQTLHIEVEDAAVDAEAIEKMKVNELLFFIQHLPVVTKTVFNLYVMEGFSHKEIAELLGVAEGTSKWHLSEARKQLKQKIHLQEVKI